MLHPSAWHFALIAAVEAAHARQGGLETSAKLLAGAGVLPASAQYDLAKQGSPVLGIKSGTLATLVWAWRDRDPADTTPPAQALYDLTRHLAYWESEDRLRELANGLGPVLQQLEVDWQHRDATSPNVVI